MKRCPKCNRLYSDMTEKCLQCGVLLSANPNFANGSETIRQQPQNVNQQQNVYRPLQDNYQKPQNMPVYVQSSSQQLNVPSKLGFGEAISNCFKKYVDPNGRARRSEFWYYYLFYIIVILATSFIDIMIGVNLLYPLAMLAMLCPLWCVMVRRFHDVGQKWTYYFWGFVPVYGWYKFISALVKDSEPVDNMFGPCPK